MKTPEKLFTELATGELECPCGTFCTAKKAENATGPYLNTYTPRTKIVSRHEQFNDLMSCMATRFSELICELLVQKRNANQKVPLPNHAQVFWPGATDQSRVPERIFVDAIKKFGLQFSVSYDEFEQEINKNFLPMCEFMWERLQKVH